MNNVYLMHIPKTGGQYFSDTLISSLNEECKKNNINTLEKLKDGHRGWSEVNEDSFIISIFRNPINRSISHYLYYNPPTIQTVDEIKKSALSFIENNEFMHDYQSKFLCSDEINFESNFNNQFFSYNMDNYYERVNRINKKIKTNSITPQLLTYLYEECCGVLNIVTNNTPNFPDYRSYLYLSPISKEIRDRLTIEEVNYLMEINKKDFELWGAAE